MNIRRLIPTEIILMALDNVRAHKFRSFLTVLGIVIGVVTVIAVSSILTGLRGSMIQMIEEYGTNNIFAFHLTTGPRLGPRDRAERLRKKLTAEDGIAVRELSPAVDDVSNMLFLDWNFDKTLTYKGIDYKRAEVQGVSPNFIRITNMYLSEGRFISEIDDEHRRNVIVIGINIAEALFPNQSQIAGNQITMGGRIFEVIGVLEKRKTGFLNDDEEDNNVFIPYQTMKKLSPRSEYMMLVIRAKTGQLASALDQVEQVLRRRRGVKPNEPNNFDLNTADRFIEQFDAITKAIGLIAIAISSVGLIVGGIGVMNIMLVSVTERTQEIGVRKAIGARRKDIVIQFLCEAMTLTFLGGVLGVILAVIVSKIIMLLLPSLPASIPLWAVVTGLLVSIGVGLIFGVWPARKASRLDPIECLRYE